MHKFYEEIAECTVAKRREFHIRRVNPAAGPLLERAEPLVDHQHRRPSECPGTDRGGPSNTGTIRWLPTRQRHPWARRPERHLR